MALIYKDTESVAGTDYFHLRFKDGAGEIHASWVKHFLSVGRLYDYLIPMFSSRRFLMARDMVMRGSFGEVNPVDARYNLPHYAYPKKHKSLDTLLEELDRIKEFKEKGLPVPFPVGYVHIQDGDHRNRRPNYLLTKYEGADTLYSISRSSVFFESVMDTDEYIIARARERDARKYSEELDKKIGGLVPEEMEDKFYAGKYRPLLRKEQRRAEREESKTATKLNKTMMDIAHKMRLTPTQKTVAIGVAANTLRRFSDAGIYIRNAASRHLIVRNTLQGYLCDFRDVQEHPEPLNRRQRAWQLRTLFNNSAMRKKDREDFRYVYMG